MPKKLYCPELQDAPEGSPSVETRVFWRDDIRLRKAGFVIHARPNKGEALWRFGGIVLPHSEAMASLQTNEG